MKTYSTTVFNYFHFYRFQRTLSVNSNDGTTSEKSTSHGSENRTCKCKTGCKAANCGCHRKQIACNDNCFCKTDCFNVFNASYKGVDSLKRTLSQESESREGTEDDKENNNEEENMQTPKKLRYATYTLYVYSQK